MSIAQVVWTVIAILVSVVTIPVAAWFVRGWIRDARRREALRALATARGLVFRDQAVDYLRSLKHFKLFDNTRWLTRRDRRRIGPVIVHEGERFTVAAFDYRYKDYGDGEGFNFFLRRTVIYICVPGTDWPALDLRPNGLYLRMTARWRERVDFDDVPEFDDRYDVTSAEPALARVALAPEVRSALVAEPRRLCGEAAGHDAVLYPVECSFWGDGRVACGDLERLIDLGVALARQWCARPQAAALSV